MESSDNPAAVQDLLTSLINEATMKLLIRGREDHNSAWFNGSMELNKEDKTQVIIKYDDGDSETYDIDTSTVDERNTIRDELNMEFIEIISQPQSEEIVSQPQSEGVLLTAGEINEEINGIMTIATSSDPKVRQVETAKGRMLLGRYCSTGTNKVSSNGMEIYEINGIAWIPLLIVKHRDDATLTCSVVMKSLVTAETENGASQIQTFKIDEIGKSSDVNKINADRCGKFSSVLQEGAKNVQTHTQRITEMNTVIKSCLQEGHVTDLVRKLGSYPTFQAFSDDLYVTQSKDHTASSGEAKKTRVRNTRSSASHENEPSTKDAVKIKQLELELQTSADEAMNATIRHTKDMNALNRKMKDAKKKMEKATQELDKANESEQQAMADLIEKVDAIIDDDDLSKVVRDLKKLPLMRGVAERISQLDKALEAYNNAAKRISRKKTSPEKKLEQFAAACRDIGGNDVGDLLESTTDIMKRKVGDMIDLAETNESHKKSLKHTQNADVKSQLDSIIKIVEDTGLDVLASALEYTSEAFESMTKINETNTESGMAQDSFTDNSTRKNGSSEGQKPQDGVTAGMVRVLKKLVGDQIRTDGYDQQRNQPQMNGQPGSQMHGLPIGQPVSQMHGLPLGQPGSQMHGLPLGQPGSQMHGLPILQGNSPNGLQYVLQQTPQLAPQQVPHGMQYVLQQMPYFSGMGFGRP